jgi:hypothetical protein
MSSLFGFWTGLVLGYCLGSLVAFLVIGFIIMGGSGFHTAIVQAPMKSSEE